KTPSPKRSSPICFLASPFGYDRGVPRHASIVVCFASFLVVSGCATLRGQGTAAKIVARGGGLQVAFDGPGWSPLLGESVIHGSYVRIAQYHAEPDRDLSLLVDDAPTNALDELTAECVKGYRDRTRNPIVVL